MGKEAVAVCSFCVAEICHPSRRKFSPGFGFIQFASPGAATRRGGKALADGARLRRSTAGHYCPVGEIRAGNVPGKSRYLNDFVRPRSDGPAELRRPAAIGWGIERECNQNVLGIA